MVAAVVSEFWNVFPRHRRTDVKKRSVLNGVHAARETPTESAYLPDYVTSSVVYHIRKPGTQNELIYGNITSYLINLPFFHRGGFH